MSVPAISFGKTALAVLALGVFAMPVASAFATSEDPTQAPVAATAAAPAAGSPAAATAAAPAAGAPAAAAPAAALTAEQTVAARALFTQYSCGACHTLGAAGGSGHIGPELDGNANLDHAYIVSRVSNGQGAMPGFGGMIAADQIDLLANYIMAVKQ